MKFYNEESGTLLSGTSDDDLIENDGSSVTIDGGAGNDDIENYGSNVSINGGEDNDVIFNWNGDSVSIDGGTGDDSIRNNYAENVTINGGEGNDTLTAGSGGSNLWGGKGNDLLYGGDGKDTFIFRAGEGTDTIFNYSKDDMLTILDEGGGRYSTYSDAVFNKNANTLTLSIKDGGTVILENVYSDDCIIINGVCYIVREFGDEEPFWTISDTTATYGTSDNILVTVNGIKSIDELAIDTDNKIVTVSKSALNQTDVTISEGYTLKLAKDVSAPLTKKAAWTIKDTTATYKSSYKTEGYSLAKDSKAVYYTAATKATTLATVTGVKSIDGLSVKDKVVTVAKSSVNAQDITISKGYTLKLAKDISAPLTKKAAWTIKDTTATYKSSYKTEGYSLAKDNKSISYTKATEAKTLATIKGVKSTNGLSIKDKVVTVAKSSLNKSKVTISGDEYTLKLADDVTKTETKKAAWTLKDTTATYNSSSTTAGYTLASNSKSITYSKAKTASTLAKITGIKSNVNPTVKNEIITLSKDSLSGSKVTISGSSYEFNFAKGDYKKTLITGSTDADLITSRGKNVIFTVGKGAVTVKNAADKEFSYSNDGVDSVYSGDSKKPYTISANGKAITLSSAYDKENFNVLNDVEDGGNEIVTIDASAVQGLNITGNAKANKSLDVWDLPIDGSFADRLKEIIHARKRTTPEKSSACR